MPEDEIEFLVCLVSSLGINMNGRNFILLNDITDMFLSSSKIPTIDIDPIQVMGV